MVFSINLLDKDDFKKAPGLIVYLAKKAVEKNELDALWKRVSALAPLEIARDLYSEEVVKVLRNCLKRETDIYFQLEDVAKALYEVITQPIDFGRPRLKKLK